MKWVTRENVKVERVACAWLVRRFVDPEAEFFFVDEQKVFEFAEKENAIPFDTFGAELDHYEGKCSFETIIDKYHINDPAVELLAQIVHGAHLHKDMYGREEAPGLKAIAEGFRLLDLADDHEILDSEFIVYDAFYAYCRQLNKMAAERIESSIR